MEAIKVYASQATDNLQCDFMQHKLSFGALEKGIRIRMYEVAMQHSLLNACLEYEHIYESLEISIWFSTQNLYSVDY